MLWAGIVPTHFYVLWGHHLRLQSSALKIKIKCMQRTVLAQLLSFCFLRILRAGIVQDRKSMKKASAWKVKEKNNSETS